MTFSSGTTFIEKGDKRNIKASNIFKSYFKTLALFFLFFAGVVFNFLFTSILNNYTNPNSHQESNIDETEKRLIYDKSKQLQ